MMKVKKLSRNIGLPRIIITLFFLMLCILSIIMELPADRLFTDVLVRVGMNGIMVLAMVPAILCGTGPNFGLPLGIVCGLLGAVLSIELDLTGFSGFFGAIIIAIPIAIIVGWMYGRLQNAVKGSEMMVATYTGFSIVSLMCIVWLIIPLNSDEMVWPIGKGLRVTISLKDRFAKILNDLWDFPLFGLKIPTGLILFFLIMCFVVWLFFRSKLGIAIKASGDNPKFARASGINIDKNRIIGTILSTVLGAIGIIVYAQSYGFIQLYQAPLMMAFPAVAAVLIGGASASKAKVSHVLVGTFLFQGLLTIALPVANSIVKQGQLSEIARMIVQNGIILYALTKVDGGE
ncbi:ABC transporter permease subunit [Abyssisolibacter fermentans]|uniref:ABC transporter permease subunit n=1 Tax=Abyssisolibacter fermentans TaxID=1766203 RepID=UPI00082A5E01|nr:ABC transporter [Abyssisolibacter fermentans]